MSIKERLDILRDRVLARKDAGITMFVNNSPVVRAGSLRASEAISSWQIRRGLLTRDKLAAMRFEMDDMELRAGRVAPLAPLDDEAREDAEQYLAQFPGLPGQTGHCELDYGPIMTVGIDGLRKRIGLLLRTSTGEAAEAYQSFLYALDGFSAMIEHAAQTVERSEIADSCRRIAHEPPASFRDAIQLLWFVILGVMHGDEVGLVVPGHLDRTLVPFYEADRAKGAISREEALALIANLYLLVNDYIPDGLAMSVMVGGRDAEGRDVTNELSYLCLEALPLTRLIYPTVGICWHPGTPPDLVELGIKLMGQGCPTPAFFGDETIQRGLQQYGVPPEESCRYINSTCVEITPSGSSNVWVASPYFSTCKILLDEIDEQVDLGEIPRSQISIWERTCPQSSALAEKRSEASGTSAFPNGNLGTRKRDGNLGTRKRDGNLGTRKRDGNLGTRKRDGNLGTRKRDGNLGTRQFADFCDRYYARLGRHIAEAVASENEARRIRRQFGRKPLQSVFTRDCIARGRDIDDGGALYNWVECSFVGMANLADSMYVIQQEIFEEKRLTLAEMKQLLDAEFQGEEATRQRFLKHHPKYGQDCAEVDELFGKTIAFVRDECAKHKILPDDSPFVPGGFCWVMHEVLGRECGATPDGRLGGTPFADGCGPAQGRETKGPTAAILSTTSWDHSPMIGGLAFNMKFTRSLFNSQQGFDGLRNLIVTFLKRGGFETQVNVVDAETLRKARQHPDQYRDLVVRIGGYCDYFTRLSPEMQDEIILRTEYGHV